MELNAEMIKKALECCGAYDHGQPCKECPYMYAELTDNEICSNRMSRFALALINKLTEDNERLNASCTEFERKCASLNDENERLKEKADRNLNNLKAVLEERCENTIVADTVRKMQEKAKALLTDEETDVIIAEGEVFIPISAIRKIAKEMLEGKNET